MDESFSGGQIFPLRSVWLADMAAAARPPPGAPEMSAFVDLICMRLLTHLQRPVAEPGPDFER